MSRASDDGSVAPLQCTTAMFLRHRNDDAVASITLSRVVMKTRSHVSTSSSDVRTRLSVSSLQIVSADSLRRLATEATRTPARLHAIARQLFVIAMFDTTASPTLGLKSSLRRPLVTVTGKVRVMTVR